MNILKFKKYLEEKIIEKEPETKKYLEHTGHTEELKFAEKGKIDSIHFHPAIEADFDDEQKKIIRKHTSSSKRTNRYLHELQTGSLEEPNEYIEHDIKKLSSAFTPENTNRKPIITYSGIPYLLGRNFLDMPAKSKHTISRFTSTTTSRKEAIDYAKERSLKYNKNDLHILKCYNKPGSGISVAPKSTYPEENEFLLHHGAHVTYIGSTIDDDSERPVYTHHVIVHSTHTPIEEYGKGVIKSVLS